MKEYEFEVNLKISIVGIEAKNENQARTKLPELVAEYLAETEIDFDPDTEAKLIGN